MGKSIKTKVICLIILLVIIVNCTKNEKNYTVTEVDDIKTYINKNAPSDPNFKITPKELFTIQLNESNPDTALRNISMRNLCIDKDKNIYLVDPAKAKIYKLDSLGNFITSFGNKGSGPGEMNVPLNLAVMSDTLYVFDYSDRKTNVFDLDGNFIKADFTASNAFFIYISKLNEEKFTGMLGLDRYENGEVYTVYQVPIYTRNSIPDKVLYSRDEFLQPHGDDWWPSRYQPAYAVGQDEIYVLENSTERYRIFVYNSDGLPLYNIRKNYRKLKLTDEDLKGTYYANTKFNKIQIYKNVASILGLHVTKDGYLLVQASIERTEENKYDYIVDAFKNGVFINTFNLDIGKAYDFYFSDHSRFFIGDRIYYLNKEESTVTVYEY